MSCNDSFEDYIKKTIDKLQLINIQDVCMGIALSLRYDHDIPDGVLTIAQLKSIENAEDAENFDYDAEFLEKLSPVQDWLVKNICIAIQKKEIKPLVLGLFMNGNVDPKRTYVQDHKILRWLGYRGIEAEIYCFGLDMYEALSDAYTTIDACINHESRLLSDSINMRSVYNPELDRQEKNYSDANEIFRLNQEVKELKSELGKHKYPHRINKYAERHAVFREQVLGAALSVLANYPEQCKNKAGKFEATKIRTLIEEKALLFWPETGAPVLSTDSIERLIREWIKKTGKTY